jgi:predicted nucleic acid-binding protein
MRLFLDTSALVKRYVVEQGSSETIELVRRAELVGTSLVSRAEMAAALAKAVRLGLHRETGRKAHGTFLSHWPFFVRIPVTEALVSRADSLAWNHALRGYDAIQLASALIWQESLGAPVTLATFDRELWQAAPKASLHVWPARLTR